MIAKVILKPDREKSLNRRHPWIFSGAIQTIQGPIEVGQTVAVMRADGKHLAWGAISPTSQITVRIWSFDVNAEIGVDFFRARVQQAMNRRRGNCDMETTAAFRLIHAESDGLPGLVVDRYGAFLVMQITAAGVERWRQQLVEVLCDHVPGIEGIWERSDVSSRLKEGLTPRTGLLFGREPPDRVAFQEGSLQFWADVKRGQKTGFYLDQRDNRAMVGALAEGREVLNVFSYTGGFGLQALAAGAQRVVQVDSSATALTMANEHLKLNGLANSQVEHVVGNAFEVLRDLRAAERTFDLVILDPPKFAENAAQIKKAARAYKDINMLGYQLLRPGGVLFTFSCSGHMAADLFGKIVADSALDAGREGVILRRLGAAADHPVALPFPEGEYLKGLICQVTT